MSKIQEPASDFSSAMLDQIVERFEQAWQAGERPDVADYLPEGEPKGF